MTFPHDAGPLSHIPVLPFSYAVAALIVGTITTPGLGPFSALIPDRGATRLLLWGSESFLCVSSSRGRVAIQRTMLPAAAGRQDPVDPVDPVGQREVVARVVAERSPIST